MTARRGFIVALAIGVLVAPFTAHAQASKIPRIGLLRTASRDAPDPAAEGLRQGLRELGHVEGQSISIEYRWAEGRPERIPALAAELVRLNVDVIVTGGENAILAAKQATSTIPIVMGASNDPVSAGLVASLARPGGNVTGMTVLSPELSRKRLQLLKEALPRASRVAILSNPAYLGTLLDLSETRSAAQELGLTLQNVEVRSPADLEAALAAARERSDVLIPLGDPFFTAHRARIVSLATKHLFPGMYYWKEFVEAGGLMSYGPSLRDLYRRAATHVDKILKGARPADLPVEQPTKFELVINLKTAK
ncbi:MAG: ABC transporter substrate-binding protein, partial [Candidatus Rokuibacteriota bacterium]